MITKKSKIFFIGLTVSILLTGCGQNPTPQGKVKNPLAKPHHQTNQNKEVIINIDRIGGFIPVTSSVKKWEPVRFTNISDTGIRVESEDPNGPNTPLIKPGESYVTRFGTAGVFDFKSTPIKFGIGTLIVQEEEYRLEL